MTKFRLSGSCTGDDRRVGEEGSAFNLVNFPFRPYSAAHRIVGDVVKFGVNSVFISSGDSTSAVAITVCSR